MTSNGISAALSPELGKYRLIAKLARGGMGDVYLAVAQGPGGFHKLVVVKEMRPEFAEDATYVAMFQEEARLAARLAHPNIVQTNEVGFDSSRHYMIMEYLDGRSLYRLAKQLAPRGGLPLGAHLRVIAEALLGLHYAHELRGFDGEPLGIVHRDVSPLNVFVTFDGQAKVLDFGIAKAADSTLETQAGILKGRIAYMAPEQASGAKVDRRADVYAAGVMIWEAAAGRRLWAGMADVEILMRTLGEGPPRLRSVRSAAPADLDALCARAMARNPDDRHPTAAALLADLDRHLSQREDAVSMRQLGAMVSGAFEPERRRMNDVIEEALLELRGTPQSGVMPAFPAREAGPATHGGVPYTRGPHDELPNVSSLIVATPSTSSAAIDRSSRPLTSVRPSRPTVPEGLRPTRSRERSIPILAMAVAAACAVVAAGATVALLHRNELAGQLAPSPPAPALPSAVVNPLVQQGDREIGRSGAPKDSRSPDLPAAPAPTAPQVQASKIATVAPKWAAPASRPVPAPAPAAPSPPPAPSTPTPAAHPDVDPAGGRAPTRPIVTSNPYGILQ